MHSSPRGQTSNIQLKKTLCASKRVHVSAHNVWDLFHILLLAFKLCTECSKVGEKLGSFKIRDARRGGRAAAGTRGFEMNFKPKRGPYVGRLPINVSLRVRSLSWQHYNGFT